MAALWILARGNLALAAFSNPVESLTRAVGPQVRVGPLATSLPRLASPRFASIRFDSPRLTSAHTWILPLPPDVAERSLAVVEYSWDSIFIHSFAISPLERT